MLTLVHYPAGFPLDKAYITPEHKFAETGCLSATIVDTEFRHCCLRRDCAGWHHGHHDRYYVYHRNDMPPKSHLFPKCARSPPTGSLARILRTRLGCKDGGREWTKLPTGACSRKPQW